MRNRHINRVVQVSPSTGHSQSLLSQTSKPSCIYFECHIDSQLDVTESPLNAIMVSIFLSTLKIPTATILGLLTYARPAEIALEFRHLIANRVHEMAATVTHGTVDVVASASPGVAGAAGAASSSSFPQRWPYV